MPAAGSAWPRFAFTPVIVSGVAFEGEVSAAETSEPASIDRLLEMMDRGDFDLVAVGRALIANPDWPKIVRYGDIAGLQAYSKDLLVSLD